MQDDALPERTYVHMITNYYPHIVRN